MNTLVLGATGLCGNNILKYVQATGKINEIHTITRSPITQNNNFNNRTVINHIEKDSNKWGELIKEQIGANKIDIVFSGLATTRASAGGTDNQYKIDHDLNIKLAKVLKEQGCKTFVIVSSLGASTESRFFYMKMKGEIEKDLIDLDFDHLIILRPGMLLGERLQKHNGWGSFIANHIGNLFYRTPCQGLVKYPIQGDDVAKAGVYLALNAKDKVQIVESDKLLDIAASCDLS